MSVLNFDQSQNYASILNELRSKNYLFYDNKFGENSIYGIKDINYNLVKWLRPYEICAYNYLEPKFIINGIEPNDLDQGKLGDCWFISGLAAITTVPEYVARVIPLNQSFSTNYYGIFRFRFWKNGYWHEVVIDDRLPTINGQLIFCHNKEQNNEMFGPLLEKAYAKFKGSYTSLIGGYFNDALVDLTGGRAVKYFIRQQDPNTLWHLIKIALNNKYLVGADVIKKTKMTDFDNGLKNNHSYTILRADELVFENNRYHIKKYSNGNSIKLLRIRNPHGIFNAFRGKWSPNSANWMYVSENAKLNLLSYVQNDGQFIISFDEFLDWFDNLNIVYIVPYQISTNQNSFDNNYDINSRNKFSWYTPGIRYNGINNPVYELNGHIINNYLNLIGIYF